MQAYQCINPCPSLLTFGLPQVKCDGRPDRCRNCERLGLDCIGLASPTTISPGNTLESPRHRDTTSSASKRRTYRSCKDCRASKTKCNGEKPACSRCRLRSTECVYDASEEPSWTRILSGQQQRPLKDRGQNPQGVRSQSARNGHHQRLSPNEALAPTSDTRAVPPSHQTDQPVQDSMSW